MIRAVALAAAVALVALPAAGGARSSDYASTALNVLPPGQSGDLLFPPTATERITFGFLPQTARWTNRPTFQQVISFDSHRPR